MIAVELVDSGAGCLVRTIYVDGCRKIAYTDDQLIAWLGIAISKSVTISLARLLAPKQKQRDH